MSEPVTKKLGRLPVKHDPRNLLMANYLDTSVLPAMPLARRWSGHHQSNWGMMANDQIGDCTCAAAAHAIQVWSKNNGKELVIGDEEIIRVYSAITGYTPDDPATDQGAVELDVLSRWRKEGIGGVMLDAWVACEPRNHWHVRAAINMFGGCYVGLNLPRSAQEQRVWSVPSSGSVTGPGAPGGWGGHAVFVVDYDQHVYTCITWGKLQVMTVQFFDRYCEESYALLCQAWAPAGSSPSGFDYEGLREDLKRLRA